MSLGFKMDRKISLTSWDQREHPKPLGQLGRETHGNFERTVTKQLAILPVEMMPHRRTNDCVMVLTVWICKYDYSVWARGAGT